MKSAKKWYSEGVALAKQGKYEEAIAHYDKAIEINPLKFWALRKKADLLSDLKRFEEAVEFFDRALSIDQMHR
ncbi:MAG: Tetratricopeptide repeat protein [Candidatus Argoarchaeum ethanivorans]|uniref:Tetratricopeptide repeat protein n=1 Tax=Candidatus Argoarchaeum ethanivorans TaxID=2608793 RepID=A0A811TEZ5_9EURY|nr:MAG: Tetratricopeptide repeat protein [Candidatus Argoarchaeum ethanivorans]